MPRKSRIQSGTGVYHVMMRGINRQRIFEEFGISDGQQLQRLDKEQRNDILSALLSRRAGIRQLQRLTGIGKNIISNISKTI